MLTSYVVLAWCYSFLSVLAAPQISAAPASALSLDPATCVCDSTVLMSQPIMTIYATNTVTSYYSTSIIAGYIVAVLAGNGTYTTTATAAPRSTVVYTQTVHNTSYITGNYDSLSNQTYSRSNTTSTKTVSITGGFTSTQTTTVSTVLTSTTTFISTNVTVEVQNVTLTMPRAHPPVAVLTQTYSNASSLISALYTNTSILANRTSTIYTNSTSTTYHTTVTPMRTVPNSSATTIFTTPSTLLDSVGSPSTSDDGIYSNLSNDGTTSSSSDNAVTTSSPNDVVLRRRRATMLTESVCKTPSTVTVVINTTIMISSGSFLPASNTIATTSYTASSAVPSSSSLLNEGFATSSTRISASTTSTGSSLHSIYYGNLTTTSQSLHTTSSRSLAQSRLSISSTNSASNVMSSGASSSATLPSSGSTVSSSNSSSISASASTSSFSIMTTADQCSCGTLQARDLVTESPTYVTQTINLTTTISLVSTSTSWSTYTETSGVDVAISYTTEYDVTTVQAGTNFLTTTTIQPNPQQSTVYNVSQVISKTTAYILHTNTSTVYIPQATAIGDCPFSDEQNYIAGGGIVYQMFCDNSPGPNIAILGWQQVGHFPACMEACRDVKGCNAVSYGGPNNCSFLTSLHDTQAMPGYTSANVTGYTVNSTNTYFNLTVTSTIVVDGGTTTAPVEMTTATAISNIVECNKYPLLDPYFDKGFDSWTWGNPGGDTTPAFASINSDIGHYDNSSAQLTCNNGMSTLDNPTIAIVELSQDISTCAGANYSISFWYMQNRIADSDTNAIGTLVSLKVDDILLEAFHGGAPDGLGNSLLGEWYLVSGMSFTATADTTSIVFELTCNPGSQLSVAIDNIDLVAIESSDLVAVASSQLLYNPYFAEGFTGWHYGSSGNDDVEDTYTFYNGQSYDGIASSDVYYDQLEYGITGGFVRLACEPQGYAYLSQEVFTSPGFTYEMSFSYLGDSVDGTNAQLQFKLDGQIVDAFAAEANYWQQIEINFSALSSYSLVEVSLLCPARNGVVEEGTPYFTVQLAQFSLVLATAASGTESVLPLNLLGISLLANSEFQNDLHDWQSSTTGAASATTSGPGYSDNISVLAYCSMTADDFSQIILSQEFVTIPSGVYEYSFWYRQDQYYGPGDSTGAYMSFSIGSTADASPIVQRLKRSMTATLLSQVFPGEIHDSTGAPVGQWNKITGSFTADESLTTISWQITCPQNGEELYVRADAFDVFLSANQPSCDETPAWPQAAWYQACTSSSSNLIVNSGFESASVLCPNILCWTTQGDVKVVSPGAGGSMHAVSMACGGQLKYPDYSSVDPGSLYVLSADYSMSDSGLYYRDVQVNTDDHYLYLPLGSDGSTWSHTEALFVPIQNGGDLIMQMVCFEEEYTLDIDNVAVVEVGIDNSVFINSANAAYISCSNQGGDDPGEIAVLSQDFASVSGQQYALTFNYYWQMNSGSASVELTANAGSSTVFDNQLDETYHTYGQSLTSAWTSSPVGTIIGGNGRSTTVTFNLACPASEYAVAFVWVNNVVIEPLHPILFSNGDFSNGDAANGFPPWTTSNSDSDSDMVSTSNPGYNGGSQAVSLSCSGRQSTQIQQTFETDYRQTYQISFWYYWAFATQQPLAFAMENSEDQWLTIMQTNNGVDSNGAALETWAQPGSFLHMSGSGSPVMIQFELDCQGGSGTLYLDNVAITPYIPGNIVSNGNFDFHDGSGVALQGWSIIDQYTMPPYSSAAVTEISPGADQSAVAASLSCEASAYSSTLALGQSLSTVRCQNYALTFDYQFTTTVGSNSGGVSFLVILTDRSTPIFSDQLYQTNDLYGQPSDVWVGSSQITFAGSGDSTTLCFQISCAPGYQQSTSGTLLVDNIVLLPIGDVQSGEDCIWTGTEAVVERQL